jgi:hypothetical protein
MNKGGFLKKIRLFFLLNEKLFTLKITINEQYTATFRNPKSFGTDQGTLRRIWRFDVLSSRWLLRRMIL